MAVDTNTVSFYVILTALLVHVSSSNAAGYTFELPDNEKVCFYEDYDASYQYIFEYSVIKGGRMDVDASIESPTGKAIYKQRKRKSDVVPFDTGKGTFAYCFSNEFSTFSHKTVYFDVKRDTVDTLAVDAGDTRPRVNTEMEESMESIYRATRLVMQYQQRYRINEGQGRFSAEHLNQRVQWWSIGQALVVLASGVGQVLLLRTFFHEKRKSSKPADNL